MAFASACCDAVARVPIAAGLHTVQFLLADRQFLHAVERLALDLSHRPLGLPLGEMDLHGTVDAIGPGDPLVGIDSWAQQSRDQRNQRVRRPLALSVYRSSRPRRRVGNASCRAWPTASARWPYEHKP